MSSCENETAIAVGGADAAAAVVGAAHGDGTGAPPRLVSASQCHTVASGR